MKDMDEMPAAPHEAGKRRAKLLPLETLVLRTIRKHGMVRPGDHVLVGASGGADSTALLFCLHRLAPRLGISLSVAHLNHGLRGAESDADEAFVRKLSKTLGLPFCSEALAKNELRSPTRGNLEEAARNARYDFLKRAARLAGASRIAVGHSRNDQAETVLLRLFRGSGIEGLAAIHPVVEGAVIRPLLECGRPDILGYLESRRIEFREDSSNRDLRFRRNRLRQEWIPYLEKNFNPRLVQTLAREAERARETSELLERLASQEYRNLRIERENGILLPAKDVNELPAAIRNTLLRQALREVRGSLRGIASCHVEQMQRLCRPGQSGRKILLPGGTVVAREFQNLVLEKGRACPEASFRYPLPVPGRCVIPEAGIEIVASLGDPAGPSQRSSRVFLNADLLPSSLMVRSRLPGDRYGGRGHRKVKKLLIDSKVGLEARTRMAVVAAGEDVVWIPGFEPAKPFRIEAGAGRCIVLEVKECNPWPAAGGGPAAERK